MLLQQMFPVSRKTEYERTMKEYERTKKGRLTSCKMNWDLKTEKHTSIMLFSLLLTAQPYLLWPATQCFFCWCYCCKAVGDSHKSHLLWKFVKPCASRKSRVLLQAPEKHKDSNNRGKVAKKQRGDGTEQDGDGAAMMGVVT